VEGFTQGNWVIIDLGDIMVHVFQKSVRQHYDLERLWGDVPVVEAAG
jgi:ribosome-associated protein